MEKMVPETIKMMSGRIKLHGRNADEEMEVIEMTTQNTFSDRVKQMMEKFAGTYLGQVVMSRTDRVLQVIEETAKWSLPQTESSTPLERPLPWLFFLPLIVCLRLLRIWISVVGVVVGYDPVTPRSLVYFIQTKRRDLRALRVHGLKAIRSREMKAPWDKSNPFANNKEKIYRTVTCKPDQQNNNPSKKSHLNEKAAEETDENTSKQSETEEPEAVHLTVNEMLDQYANEDSEFDSDYVPTNDEDDNALYSTTTDDDTKEDSFEHDEKFIKMMKAVESDLKNNEKIKTNGQTNNNHSDRKMHENGNIETNGKEDITSPKQYPEKNGTSEKEEGNENPAAEVAPPKSLNTPIANKLNHLGAPQYDENDKKSTPGHESAASLKPQLAETGSMQDFHSYFHPAPIVQDFSNQAKTSTPTEPVNNEADSSVVLPLENQATSRHQRNVHHNKNHQNHRHFNVKNRNKKRR